ncbi:hypothetical protein BWQ96_08365 [Gracilariopsis chorda]|uniref:Uncharacterized protein n=1 Tax=Gracilariopsis chorda TaxID=448386 RepID=A0A2V3IIQ6_9FLOR|nr:hypothetical protein BWQ96_08365 [Gracilariopsis chorda]|eukprot:PXF41913.1 hypothetical protein BWQ96_08365 [Gracilariopsis chorda]
MVFEYVGRNRAKRQKKEENVFLNLRDVASATNRKVDVMEERNVRSLFMDPNAELGSEEDKRNS